MSAMLRDVLLTFILCSVLLTVPSDHQGIQTCSMADDEPVWTVMVYMAADASPELPWQHDVNEMEAADLGDWLNVLLLVDPLGSDDSFLIRIEHDRQLSPDITSPVLDDAGAVIPSGEANMALSETLSDFIVFCVEEYPADRYALVLWGHGAGWYGLCPDGIQLMSLPALRLALESAEGATHEMIDILVTDNCVEGVMETMFEVREHALCYVGSEDLVSSEGYRYDWVLEALNDDPWQTPEEWGAQIVALCEATAALSILPATTGAFDLTLIEDLALRMDDFFEVALRYEGLFHTELLDSVTNAQSINYTDWYVDLGDLLRRFLGSTTPIELRHLALDALDAYSDFVIAFAYCPGEGTDMQTLSNYTGAGIYLPSSGFFDAAYDDLQLSSLHWDELSSALRTDKEDEVSSGELMSNLSDTDSDGRPDGISLEWSPSQGYLEAWIFVSTDQGIHHLDTVVSYENEIIIAATGGDLMISTSAGHDESMVEGYAELGITLHQALELSVGLAGVTGEDTEEYEIRAITSSGEFDLQGVEGTFRTTLDSPSDAQWGETITVLVVNTAGGDIIGIGRVVCFGEDMDVDIDLIAKNEPEDGGSLQTVAVAAAIFAVIALLLTGILYRRNRPGRGPSETLPEEKS